MTHNISNTFLSFANVVKERFPLRRVDDAVLIEKEFTKFKAKIFWFLQSEDASDMHKVSIGEYEYFVAQNGERKSLFSRLFFNVQEFINSFNIFKIKAKVDFVQAKDVYFSGLVTLIYAKVRRVPFFFWLSFPFPEAQLVKVKEGVARYPFFYFVRGHLYKFLQYKVLMPLADHIFVQSEKMKSDYVERGVDPSKLSSVPMGCEIHQFPELSALSQDEVQPYTVGYLGTMSRIRHLDFLLDSFALVAQDHPDSILYMIGGSHDELEDVKMLKDHVRDLGLDKNVVFTGFIPQDDAFELIRKVALCVSPFYPSFILDSTSPTKLIEYMALAKPCVVNNHPEQQLIVEQSGCGLRVDWSEESFSQAIITILNDPELGKVMGIKGRRWVESNRDYTVLAKELHGEYCRLIER